MANGPRFELELAGTNSRGMSAIEGQCMVGTLQKLEGGVLGPGADIWCSVGPAVLAYVLPDPYCKGHPPHERSVSHVRGHGTIRQRISPLSPQKVESLSCVCVCDVVRVGRSTITHPLADSLLSAWLA